MILGGLAVPPQRSDAAYTQVDISGLVNSNIQTYTNGGNYPNGGTTLTNAGVSFLLADYPGGGTGSILTPSASPASPAVFDIPVNIANPGVVYTLINSGFGTFGATVGAIEFKATGGLDYTVDLVEGQNIRDHLNDGFNNIIGLGPRGVDYVQTFSFDGDVRLDEQAFVLPAAFNSATLTNIIFIGTGNIPDGEPFLAAATVGPSAVPEPSSLVLGILGLGGLGMVAARRRRPGR